MTSPPDGTRTPRRRAGLATVELDGELVVYDPGAGALHVLNASAALVWDHCDGTTLLDDLVGALDGAVACSRAQLAADVTATLDALRHGGLVESES